MSRQRAAYTILPGQKPGRRRKALRMAEDLARVQDAASSVTHGPKPSCKRAMTFG